MLRGMNRREFLLGSVAAVTAGRIGTTTAASGTPRPAPEPVTGDEGVTYHDVRGWGVAGRGWPEQDGPFRRLPPRAQELVRDRVWALAQHTAGLSVDFETDADEVHVRYALTSENLAMPHMPATGVSGADLYGRDGDRWAWLGVTLPRQQRVTAKLVEGLAPGRRRFRLYFPLYNGVESMAVGVPASATFAGVVPPADPPIVYYGTSIAQGACASRPGMAFTSILSRRLDRPLINLGFSGNGKLEPEVGRLIAELDAAVYVIDCLPNCTVEETAERTAPLVRLLREARPGVPIVLVEDRTHGGTMFRPSLASHHAGRRAAFREAYESLRDAGVEGLHYVGGEDLLGEDDGEATTDGSHPSDLGMMRYANALEPTLRRLLAG